MVPVDEQRMAAYVLHQFRVDCGTSSIRCRVGNRSEIRLMIWGINAGGGALMKV
jgi:hypothetical protein